MSSEVIRVQGVLHFPDEAGKTFIVGEGCEIIGAGGANCTYIVEPGGKIEAHSGNGNRYKIKEGGYFKGFNHPAENCFVEFSQTATVEQIEAGPGTTFTMVN